MTKNDHGVECKIADPCVKCMRGALHPPLLATYDEERGDYTLATERVCMARWASTNRQHGAGSICGLPVFRSAGEFNLCEHHYWRVIDYRYWDKPREEIEEKTRALREADSEYEQAVLDSKIHRERIAAEHSCVYYIRRTSDGAVKIGTTAALKKRMAALRAEFGEIQILLTHSGGRSEERKMHDKFADYRLQRSEWFVPAKPLLTWVMRTRGLMSLKATQRNGILHLSELTKLVTAAPADKELRWKNGRVAWPPPSAAESAA